MVSIAVGAAAGAAFAAGISTPDVQQVPVAGTVTDIFNVQDESLFVATDDAVIRGIAVGEQLENDADADLGAKMLQIVIAHQISQSEDKRVIDCSAEVCKLRLINKESASQLNSWSESNRIVDEIRVLREKFSEAEDFNLNRLSQLLDSVLLLGQKYQNFPLQALARFVASFSLKQGTLSEKERVFFYDRMANAVGQLSRGYRRELGGILDAAQAIKKEVREGDEKSALVKFDRWALELSEAVKSKVMDCVAKYNGAGWRRIADRYGLTSGEVADLEKKIADSDPVFRDFVRGSSAEEVRKKFELPVRLFPYLLRKSFDAGTIKEALITGKADCTAVAKKHGIAENDIPDYMLRFAHESKSFPLSEEVLAELRHSPGDIMRIDLRNKIDNLGLKRRMMEVASIFKVRSYVLAEGADGSACSRLQDVPDASIKFTWWYIQSLPAIQAVRLSAETSRME